MAVVLPAGWRVELYPRKPVRFVRDDRMFLEIDMESVAESGQADTWLLRFDTERELYILARVHAGHVADAIQVVNQHYPMPEWWSREVIASNTGVNELFFHPTEGAPPAPPQ